MAKMGLGQALGLGGDVLNHTVGGPSQYGMGPPPEYDYGMLQNSGIYGPPGGMLDSLFGDEAKQPERQQFDEQMPESRGPQLPMTPEDAEQNIAISAFKPKKRSALGTIGDFFSVLGGGGTPFLDRIHEKNLQRSMEGFTHDPMETVRRVATFDPQTAWKMYQTVRDDERADTQADSLNDTRAERYMTRIGGMLNRVIGAKDPQAAWTSAQPMIRKYAETHNIDISDLPEQYDPEAISSYISGSVSPEDQIRMEALQQYRDARMKLEETKEEGRNDRANASRESQEARARMAEEGRNARAAAAEKGRMARSKTGGKVIQTPNGPMVLSPDGNTGGIIINGQKTVWQKTGQGQWKRVK